MFSAPVAMVSLLRLSIVSTRKNVQRATNMSGMWCQQFFYAAELLEL
jgi:hypothetical protein